MKTTHTATGYGCCCDLLPGWTASSGHDFKKFHAYVLESIRFYVDCAREDGEEYPALFDGEFEVVYSMDACALLAYYQGVITFSGLEKFTGINQRQLAHYAAGRSTPRPKQEQRILAGLQTLGNQLKTDSVFV